MGTRTNVASVDSLRFAEQAANPSTGIAADFAHIFRKIDGFYVIDENSVVNMLVQAPDGATPQTIIDSAELSNTWIGDQVGTTSGGNSGNTFVGQLTGAANESGGSDNTFVGASVGTANTTGDSNTAIGSYAYSGATTGTDNTALGDSALDGTGIGSNNTVVGSGAMGANGVGSTNVAVGRSAGSNVTGSGNVLLGYQAGAAAGAVSNKLYIMNSNSSTPLIYGEFDGGLKVQSQGAAKVALTVQKHASQSVDVLQLGDPGGGNYTAVEADGTLEFNGDATVWDDLRIPGLSVKLGASAPDLVAFLGAGNLKAYAFDGGATSEEVHFTIQLPHSYKEGTDITPHVHWSPTTANAGNVQWFLEYSWANIDATFPAVTTINVIDAASGTAWDHQMGVMSAITGTSKTISSMLVCRLYRDPTGGSDTYGDDASLLEIDFHFEMDTVGSRTVSAK